MYFLQVMNNRFPFQPSMFQLIENQFVVNCPRLGFHAFHSILFAGRIIQTVQCEEYPQHKPGEHEYCSIAVYGDILVSSAYRSNAFHIFRLK